MNIEALYVESSVCDDPMVDHFARLLKLEPSVIADHNRLYRSIKNQSDPWQAGKQVLLLTKNHGPFLKKCPGTREYTCCDYQILHIGTYCTMDCAYCILQSYFHPPVLQYFLNHSDLFTELDSVLRNPDISYRIGTGEFTDSLIWEPYSDLTPNLVDRFSRQHRSILELKTKTTNIKQLKGLDHNRKTILAWSLNTPHVIANQERQTTPLKSRLQAAEKCEQWGYPVAFHFDPIILYPGCETDYREVVQAIFDHVHADNIVWISLGTFRYMPGLFPVVQERFPKSDIIYGEFIPGLDGKMRYFKPLRIRIYQKMVKWIRELAPATTVYLCMEDDQVWSQSFGFTPQTKGGLPAMLDESARRVCGLK